MPQIFKHDHEITENYYLNTILNSKLLLDEDMQIILDYCELSDSKEEPEQHYNWICISTLCFGAAAWKYRYLGAIFVGPFVFYSIFKIYKEQKLKKYKSNVQSLTEVFTMLHRTNFEIFHYLKTRESFRIGKNANFISNITEHVIAIIKKEIAIIDELMLLINELCDSIPSNVISREEWTIKDLNLDSFKNQQDCYNNFQKIHDITILILSKFLCCSAIATKLKTPSLLDKIIPCTLNISKTTLHDIKKTFNTMRSITTSKNLRATQENKTTAAAKLEQPLVKLTTHLQMAFETAEELRQELGKPNGNLEDFAEHVVGLQEEIALCERNLDLFCGTYGILIKRNLKKREETKGVSKEMKEVKVKVVDFEERDEFEEGKDEEYELYIGDDDDADENEKVGDCYEDEEQSKGLLLVLQELKDKLRERQILRAKKLGLPLPEPEFAIKNEMKEQINREATTENLPRTTTEVTFRIPPPPPILNIQKDVLEEVQRLNAFTDKIKMLASQRQCCEDVFENSDDESI